MPQNKDKFSNMLEELAAEYPELEPMAMQLQGELLGEELGEDETEMEIDVLALDDMEDEEDEDEEDLLF